MGSVKKGLILTESFGAEQVVMSMSKAALGDIVIDLVRQKEGFHIEGRELAEAVARSAEPVLLAREDRPIDISAWARKLQRRSKGTSCAGTVDALVARWFGVSADA